MLEIHQPEVEALIRYRLTAGGFESVEDVLLQALQDAPLPNKASTSKPKTLSGIDIVAAFQNSPHKDIDILPESYVLRISKPVEF